jgi:hypothetical protein
VIQFDVVRKECDIRCRSFVSMGTGSGGKGNDSGTGKHCMRVQEQIKDIIIITRGPALPAPRFTLKREAWSTGE